MQGNRQLEYRYWSYDIAIASIILAVAVFIASLIGISTRPAGFLASLWPANAVMLGLMLRIPAAAHPAGWLSAFAAFVAADLLSGSTLFVSFALNTANLVSVGTAYYVYKKLSPLVRELRDPKSMLYLMLTSAIAANAAGAMGAVLNILVFQAEPFDGWVYWSTAEFVNYIAILPIMLTLPAWNKWTTKWPGVSQWLSFRTLAPTLALVLSCVAAALIGGMGAIAFPVPALLWCALTYPVLPTAILTLLFVSWTLFATTTGMLLSAALPADGIALASARLGITLMAIAPVMLSTVMSSRNELLSSMVYLATHDTLTDALNRGAFFEQASAALSENFPVGVLMVDIDHFKTINDTYGHIAGDATIAACARRMQGCLRSGDVFGRLGGEEFAMVLRVQTAEELNNIAERIRGTIAHSPVTLPDGQKIPVTVSIGLSFSTAENAAHDLGDLLAEADDSLYAAKRLGRNRIA